MRPTLVFFFFHKINIPCYEYLTLHTVGGTILTNSNPGLEGTVGLEIDRKSKGEGTV